MVKFHILTDWAEGGGQMGSLHCYALHNFMLLLILIIGFAASVLFKFKQEELTVCRVDECSHIDTS